MFRFVYLYVSFSILHCNKQNSEMLTMTYMSEFKSIMELNFQIFLSIIKYL